MYAIPMTQLTHNFLCLLSYCCPSHDFFLVVHALGIRFSLMLLPILPILHRSFAWHYARIRMATLLLTARFFLCHANPFPRIFALAIVVGSSDDEQPLSTLPPLLAVTCIIPTYRTHTQHAFGWKSHTFTYNKFPKSNGHYFLLTHCFLLRNVVIFRDCNVAIVLYFCTVRDWHSPLFFIVFFLSVFLVVAAPFKVLFSFSLDMLWLRWLYHTFCR